MDTDKFNDAKNSISAARLPAAMSRRAAAEYLSVSTRTLDDLLTTGELTKLKLGRKTLVRRVDLDAFLERLAEGGQE